MLELAIVAIAFALLGIIISIAFFYRKIDREQMEIIRIKEKILFHEESVKKISRLLVAIRGELSTV
jgi:hypothetical protein